MKGDQTSPLEREMRTGRKNDMLAEGTLYRPAGHPKEKENIPHRGKEGEQDESSRYISPEGGRQRAAPEENLVTGKWEEKSKKSERIFALSGEQKAELGGE